MRERIRRGGNRSLLLSPLVLTGALVAGCGSAATQAPNPAALHRATVVAQALGQQTQTAKAHTIATVQALATAVVLNGNGAVNHFASQPSPPHWHPPAGHVSHRAAKPRPTPARPTATPTPVPPTAIPVSAPPTVTATFKRVPGVLRKGKHHHAKPRPTPTIVAPQVTHISKHRSHKHHSHPATSPTPVVVAMAQPTVHVLGKSELAYRAHVLTITGKVSGISATLKQAARSIDPSRPDYDPSVLQQVSTSLRVTSAQLGQAGTSLTTLKAPRSYILANAQTNMQTALDEYRAAVQYLRQAVSELEAGSRDMSSNDLTIGSSSIQQGDQALQNAQTLLSALH